MHSLVIFIIFCFTCYSGTEMIVYMRGPFAIFEKFRVLMGNIHTELGELLGCEYCTSTWFSGLISLINILIIPSIPFTPFTLILGTTNLWWLIIILDSLLGSGTSWLLFRLEDALLSIKERENA